jgi:hypothetical protein
LPISAVAGLVQRQGERLLLVAVLVEGEVPAVVAGVGEDPVVMGVLAGEDGRAGRTAQRVHDVVAGQGRSGLLEGHQVRHLADQVPGQVVGEHEDEVRPVVDRGLGVDGGRGRTAGQYDGDGGEEEADHGSGKFPGLVS